MTEFYIYFLTHKVLIYDPHKTERGEYKHADVISYSIFICRKV